MEIIKKKITLYYNNIINFFTEKVTQSSSREGFMRYFKNTGWFFIGRIFGMVTSFFVGAYVTRYLGPSQYGLLSYAGSFSGIFAILASFGIDRILNRELISYPEKKDELMGSAFFIKILGAILSIILIIITLIIIKADSFTSILILISASSFIFNAFGIIEIYFQSNVLAKDTVKVQIVSLIFSSILKLLFIFLNLDLIYFAIILIFDGVISTIGLLLIYRKIGFRMSSWKINNLIVRMLLKTSWPLMLSGVAISIYMKIDQIMIKNMIGNEAVGIYSAASKISETWYFIPGIICASLFPAIINAKKINTIIYEKRLKNLYSLMFYISLGIAIPISLLSSLIIIYLYGSEYTGAISVLKIHIWAGIGVFLGHAITQYLIAENFVKIFFSITIIGAIINIILNLILIPKSGIIGAAIATAISYTIVTFSVLFFKKSRNQGFLMIKSILLIK